MKLGRKNKFYQIREPLRVWWNAKHLGDPSISSVIPGANRVFTEFACKSIPLASTH